MPPAEKEKQSAGHTECRLRLGGRGPRQRGGARRSVRPRAERGTRFRARAGARTRSAADRGAYEYDDDTEEFDISVDDEPEPAGTVIAAGPQKETPGNYVVKYDRTKLSWIITKKGSQRVIRRVQTKEEALRIARELCKKTGAGLYVHKKDGKFQKI